MSDFSFKPAEKRGGKIFGALAGAGGSGKTYSALLLARGLVGPQGKIAVLDTEGDRSLAYAEDPKIGEFQHCSMSAPFSSLRFLEGAKAAAELADCVIIDSFSHEHEAEGGLLETAEDEAEKMLKKNPNNRAVDRLKWKEAKRRHTVLMNGLAALPVHKILCLKRRTVSVQVGKEMVERMKTICEKNLEFEVMFLLNLNQDDAHRGEIEKIVRRMMGMEFMREGAKIDVAFGASFSADAAPPLADKPGEALAWEIIAPLYDKGMAAALGGKKELAAWWKSLTEEEQTQMKKHPDLQKLKEVAGA